MCMPWCLCMEGCQRTVCGTLISPPTTPVLGIELSLSGLERVPLPTEPFPHPDNKPFRRQPVKAS